MKHTQLIAAAALCAVLTACGAKEAVSPVTETETAMEVVETTADGKVEIPAVTIQNEAQSEETEEKKETAAEGIKPKNSDKPQDGQATDGIYEDNFAVDTGAAAVFADKIKAAVAAKDLEALADLTAFPVYVGIAQGGVETREAFIALGAEKIFTPGLMESVGGADTSSLTPSMAGFSISKDGKSNIIFGVVEGRLAISGINYE